MSLMEREQTTVSIHTWSSTHNSKNFKDPDKFDPEWWLGLSNADNRDGSNPFLLGPRACIGQRYASFLCLHPWKKCETNTVLAWQGWRCEYWSRRWRFCSIMKLVDDKLDWERDSHALILWQKPQSWINVTPRGVS
jgi:hypothetical protein